MGNLHEVSLGLSFYFELYFGLKPDKLKECLLKLMALEKVKQPLQSRSCSISEK